MGERKASRGIRPHAHETPEALASTTATLAGNAARLARALKATPHPRR